MLFLLACVDLSVPDKATIQFITLCNRRPLSKQTPMLDLFDLFHGVYVHF